MGPTSRPPIVHERERGGNRRPPGTSEQGTTPFLSYLATVGPIRLAEHPDTDHAAYANLLAGAPRTGWCPVLVAVAEDLAPPADLNGGNAGCGACSEWTTRLTRLARGLGA
ncbi:MAG: hypothetical protein ACT4RN_01105 [Pseudonocardia sp.]